jgi:iron(III) transport system substrate-binding protein
MFRKPSHLVVALFLVTSFKLLNSTASAQSVNVDAARKEGKVVIYGTVVPQVMTQIEKGFEAKYGIKTEYWRADATKVIDRVLTEWRAGKPGFDVVIGARGPVALGKQDNVYAKFSPASTGIFPGNSKIATAS